MIEARQLNRLTRYLNTDLVLTSPAALTALSAEFDHSCCVLYEQQDDDGNWHLSVESNATENVAAADDIQKMLSVLAALSPAAKQQWDSCTQRDINIGFDCGDTWAYPHSLPHDALRMIVDAGCTLSLTLYPIRDEDEEASRKEA